VDVRDNPTSFTSIVDLMRSPETERSTGGSGGPSGVTRMLRERTPQRLRPNSNNFPGTSIGGGVTGGRRFMGGLGRRFGDLGDYMVSADHPSRLLGRLSSVMSLTRRTTNSTLRMRVC
jgi:hypothetical protein